MGSESDLDLKAVRRRREFGGTELARGARRRRRERRSAVIALGACAFIVLVAALADLHEAGRHHIVSAAVAPGR